MLNFWKKACHFIFVCYASKGIEKNWGKIQKVRKLRATVFLRDTSVEMFLLVRSYLRQSRTIVHTIRAMAKNSIYLLIDALHFNGKTKSANTNNNSLIQGKSSCNFQPIVHADVFLQKFLFAQIYEIILKGKFLCNRCLGIIEYV